MNQLSELIRLPAYDYQISSLEFCEQPLNNPEYKVASKTAAIDFLFPLSNKIRSGIRE
jgi:hypothetical protein